MDFNIKSLNKQQRIAVETTQGPILILAGAGSGKTRVITYRIAHLIKNKKTDPGKILAVTFTNKAAQEMKTRVQELLGKTQKGLVVSTFHSFGSRMLRSYIDLLGYKKNFTICSEYERLILIKQAIEALPARRPLDPKIVAYAISNAKNRFTDIPDYGDMEFSADLRQVHQYYQERLRINNLVDFDDLLILPLLLFKEHAHVLENLWDRFHYFMVDEYQDTNIIQYELISSLARYSQNLCVVGDDDQSIYGWRGAEVGNIINFEEQWSGAKVIKLEQNYRSTDVILNAANEVIKNNKGRRDKALWTAIKGGEGITFFSGETPEDEAEEVVNRIRQLQYRQHAQLGDIAILFRRNIQSKALVEALRLNNVLYLLIGSTDFFERREIKDIFPYLALIVNPNDEIALGAAISVPRRGIGPQTIQKIRTFAIKNRQSMMEIMLNQEILEKILDGKAEAVHDFALTINAIHNRQFHAKPAAIVTELIDQISYKSFVRKTSKDEKEAGRRLKVVDDFVTSLENYQKKTTNPSLENYLERIALANREDRKENIAKGRVSLMTIHAAKGLEFPYVFIVGLEEDIFPSARSIEENKLSEERRLCYVGMTRAKKKLYLSVATQRRYYGNVKKTEVSRFIKEIPDKFFVNPPGQKGEDKEKEMRSKAAAKDFFKKKKELFK